MGILSGLVVPTDVREVIDRTDEKMDKIVQEMSINSDMLAEQNCLLAQQNKILEKLVTAMGRLRA